VVLAYNDTNYRPLAHEYDEDSKSHTPKSMPLVRMKHQDFMQIKDAIGAVEHNVDFKGLCFVRNFGWRLKMSV
jgi:hypothetical protein